MSIVNLVSVAESLAIHDTEVPARAGDSTQVFASDSLAVQAAEVTAPPVVSPAAAESLAVHLSDVGLLTGDALTTIVATDSTALHAGEGMAPLVSAVPSEPLSLPVIDRASFDTGEWVQVFAREVMPVGADTDSLAGVTTTQRVDVTAPVSAAESDKVQATEVASYAVAITATESIGVTISEPVTARVM